MNKFLSILSLSFLFYTGTSAQQIAFPGAEGFGKYATGGRGGKVYTVTNLNDSGLGSFREAFNSYPGEPLTIVFAVGGTIELQSQIKVNRSNITIAGQTAPGDGICLKGHSLIFNGARAVSQGGNHNNIIIRYLRSRPGSTLSTGVYGFDLENVDNVIVDHCSFSWANEECAAMYDMKNITVQYCIISEGLFNAGHAKGNRGYGGVWGGQYASFHHNLFAHLNARSTRFNGARAHDFEALIDYRNNVVYNAGSRNAAAGGAVNLENAFSRINLVNNYYKPGPATPSDYLFLEADYEPAEAKGIGEFYVSGNIMYGNTAKTSDNWSAVNFTKIPSESLSKAKSLNPFSVSVPIPSQSAGDAYLDVLKNAGAILPIRDAVDKRVISETATGTASSVGLTSGKWGIIDSPNEVGGWPIYNSGMTVVDTDGDGIPDTWEDANALNKHDAADGNLVNGQGYTKLEEYLNSITATQATVFELLGFAATLKEATTKSVDLVWTISHDLTVQTIEVERSADGTAFISLTNIASKQNSGLSEYTFTDNNVLNDISYYRLKITDANNKITHSEVKQINNPIAYAYWTEPFTTTPITAYKTPAIVEKYNQPNGEWILYGARKITNNITDVNSANDWSNGVLNPRLEILNTNQTATYSLTEAPYIITPVFSQGISKITFNEVGRDNMSAGSIIIYTSKDEGQTWSNLGINTATKTSKFDLITVKIEEADINRLKIAKPAGVTMTIDNLSVYAPVGVVLPLKLISFTAQTDKKLSNNVWLNWKTTNEKNTLYFDVEKSIDGKEFSKIGQLNAKNTEGIHIYSFTDELPFAGVNYYRLKQVDIDGKYVYSNIQFVDNISLVNSFKVYPNPASSYLQFLLDKTSDINIYDLSGRKLYALTNVENEQKIDLSKFKNGIYLLEIIVNNKKSVIRFIKE